MRILSDNDYLLSTAMGPSKPSKQPANSTGLNSKCSWKVLFYSLFKNGEFNSKGVLAI